MFLKRVRNLYVLEIDTIDLVQNACLNAGFKPKIVCETSDITTVLNLG